MLLGEEALKIYEAYAKQNPEQFSSDVKRVKDLFKGQHFNSVCEMVSRFRVEFP